MSLEISKSKKQIALSLVAGIMLLAGCTEKQKVDEIKWAALTADGWFQGLSVALWAPSSEIRSGSLANVVIMLKNRTNADLVIRKDVLGYFALQAVLDGAAQPIETFAYRCAQHEHEWTLRPGDVVMTQIPVFTGDAMKRVLDMEDLHGLPLPVESSRVAVYGGNAKEVVVRIGLPESNNKLAAAGVAECTFTVKP